MMNATMPLVQEMQFEFAGKTRETVIDPLYKRVDKHGRLYIDRDLAEQEVLILIVKPMQEDKINYIKVGR